MGMKPTEGVTMEINQTQKVVLSTKKKGKRFNQRETQPITIINELHFPNSF